MVCITLSHRKHTHIHCKKNYFQMWRFTLSSALFLLPMTTEFHIFLFTFTSLHFRISFYDFLSFLSKSIRMIHIIYFRVKINWPRSYHLLSINTNKSHLENGIKKYQNFDHICVCVCVYSIKNRDLLKCCYYYLL